MAELYLIKGALNIPPLVEIFSDYSVEDIQLREAIFDICDMHMSWEQLVFKHIIIWRNLIILCAKRHGMNYQFVCLMHQHLVDGYLALTEPINPWKLLEQEASYLALRNHTGAQVLMAHYQHKHSQYEEAV